MPRSPLSSQHGENGSEGRIFRALVRRSRHLQEHGESGQALTPSELTPFIGKNPPLWKWLVFNHIQFAVKVAW
jgi:hypothetical protein